MLHIYFSRDDEYDKVLTEDNYRIQPTFWFDFQDGARFIQGPVEQQIIADIDKGRVLGSGAIDFPIFGVMSPDKLSGTSKTLILANNEPEVYVNGDFVGNNGLKWLIHLAKTKDIFVRAGHILEFYQDFQAHIINDDSYISTWYEFIDKGDDFLHEGNP